MLGLHTRLARNAVWSFLGQGVSIVLQAGYFVAIARLLGSTNYGIYTAAFALVSILSQYASLGSGYIFLRNVSAVRGRFAEYWGNILLSTAGFGSILVALAVLLGHVVLSRTQLLTIFCVAVGDTICQQLTSTIGQVFQTFENLRTMALLNIAVNAARLSLALAMLFTIRHATAYQWAFASMFISMLATAIATMAVSINFGLPVFRWRTLEGHIGEGFVFSFSGSTTYIYNDLDKVMLGHFGMNRANGIYTTAYRVLNICSTPITSIHNAAYPRFFQLGAKGLTYAKPFALRILRRTTVLGALSAVGMFVCAPILPFVVGKSFANSVVALRWLCLIPLFRCFHLSAGDAMAGSGYQNYRLINRIGAAVFNFVLNLILIPHFSWVGAAWASLATDGGLGVADWITVQCLTAKENKQLIANESQAA